MKVCFAPTRHRPEQQSVPSTGTGRWRRSARATHFHFVSSCGVGVGQQLCFLLPVSSTPRPLPPYKNIKSMSVGVRPRRRAPFQTSLLLQGSLPRPAEPRGLHNGLLPTGFWATWKAAGVGAAGSYPPAHHQHPSPRL